MATERNNDSPETEQLTMKFDIFFGEERTFLEGDKKLLRIQWFSRN